MSTFNRVRGSDPDVFAVSSWASKTNCDNQHSVCRHAFRCPCRPPPSNLRSATLCCTEKVFRRYVASASTWHSRLVRFFQAQPPSPRRCEELPWHLNKCYRWHPLKNSLVDLRTFEVSSAYRICVSRLSVFTPTCLVRLRPHDGSSNSLSRLQRAHRIVFPFESNMLRVYHRWSRRFLKRASPRAAGLNIKRYPTAPRPKHSWRVSPPVALVFSDDVDDDPIEEGADGLLETPDGRASLRQRGSGGSRPQERQ